LIGAGVAFEAFLTGACRATFAIKRFSQANEPAHSASNFGRICRAFAIRNDLLRFSTEKVGVSVAQLSRLSSRLDDLTDGLSLKVRRRVFLLPRITLAPKPISARAESVV
jgi:hypothetical protein